MAARNVFATIKPRIVRPDLDTDGVVFPMGG
jgi:hypothetical protein